MAQKYFPMLSIDKDRAYSDKDFAEYYKMLFQDGVAIAAGDALKIKESASGGMRVVLSGGMAIMQGFQYINTDDLTVTVPVASTTQDRTDSVVIRHDTNAREIYVAVKQGDVTVERTDLVWELQLATIIVPRNAVNIPAEYITDKRADETVCGYSSPFENINVSGLEDQYNALLETAYSNFVDNSTASLDASQSQFQAWFYNLQNQLTANQATNLQNQIDNIKAENELITIEHNLGIYPRVECLYWEYGLGTVPLEAQPPGISWDGTAPETVNVVAVKAEYPDSNTVVVSVPLNRVLDSPTITQIENKWLLQEGHKSIQVMLGENILGG